MTLGGKIKKARVAARMTQERLAEVSGVRQESISRVETGDQVPTIRTAKALAKALGLDFAALVGAL